MGVKITDLPEQLTPTSDAVVEIVNDPSGTPASEKVPLSALPLPSSLKITYTGTPQTALVLPITMASIAVVPVAAVGGQATYAAVAGPSLAAWAYNETNLAIGNRLLTISFDDLVAVSGTFAPTNLAGLTALELPTLVNVGTNFTPSNMAALTTLTLTSLTNVGGLFNLTSFGALTTLSLPALASVGATFAPSSMASLTTFSMPVLVNIGANFNPSSMGSLTTLSAPVLAKLGGQLGPSNMASLTTASFPELVSVGGTVAMNSSLGNLANVTLGTIGTLKSIGGATINISGQKLTADSVNGILALLVSLDGTDGTTLWGSGKTLTINGGTNSAPTGLGITDKATLQARGATVTTN